jgi:glycosyltransferase involved in cell wall biosynthesis
VDCRSPTISLIIPTYNRGHLIAETLDSALAQDPPFLEIIVVDDGSTDHTSSVLALYADRVQLLGGRNDGVQRARNRGVAAASSEFIAMCDSDDLLEAGYVGAMQDWLRVHPECNSIYSNFATFDENSVHADKLSSAPSDFFDGAQRTGAFWHGMPDLYRRILRFQPLFPSGNVIRRSLYIELGGYDSRFNGVGAEDFEFALRLVEAGETAVCATPLIRIRRHGANDSTDNVRQVHGTIEILEFALVHHRSATVYREAVLASMDERRIDVFNGAFTRGAFDMAKQMLDLLRHPPGDKKFRLKAMITRLPPLLRGPLWRVTQ